MISWSILQGGVKRTVRCKCSFLEIYNETLTDLLSPSDGQHLQIREDANHGIYVENLCEEAVGSSESLSIQIVLFSLPCN